MSLHLRVSVSALLTGALVLAAPGARAQLASSPAPVTVPAVTVDIPVNAQAKPAERPVKAPAAAQQSTTPRAQAKPAATASGENTAGALAAGDGALDASAVTVAPTGHTQPVDTVASSVTVVTSDEIDGTQRRTGNDVLKSVPGVNVVQGGGPGALTSVFIRGTNSNHSKAIIDGIDVTDPSGVNRAFNFGHLSTLDLDRIEVLRGPQSGLYGADAIGGVIVAYSKKGDGPLKVEGLAEAGSFGTFNQALSARGSGERYNYAFSFSHLRSNDVPVTPLDILLPGTPRINSNYDNKTYATKLGVDVTRDLTLNFVTRYSETAFGFQGDSFSFVDFTNRPDPVKSTQDTRQLYMRGEAVWSLYGGRLRNYFGVNWTDLSTKDFAPSAGRTFADGQRVKFDWRGVLQVASGVVVTVGADHQNEKMQVVGLDAAEENTGAYVQLQVEPVRNLFLTGNLRRDDNENFGGATTWRFAPVYLIEETGTKLKGSVGTAFKAPSLSQRFQDFPAFLFFANPNLKPEESTGYEIGFEQALFANRAQFGATWFWNDVTNLINGTYDPTTFISSVDNIGKATTNGVELFASADLTDTLRLRADYTYLEAFDAIKNAELARRPRHKASISAGWKPTPLLLLTGSVVYTGTSIDYDRPTFNQITLPDYTVVNIAADYNLTDNVSLFGRIDNLFDKHYQNPAGFEATGIGAYAGVKLRN